ncbi:MAG: hypothetical protein K6G68_09865 [Oscillospiraceae bacterium]|nr:hypothetical protein [Oscillospiraceae bacterium]
MKIKKIYIVTCVLLCVVTLMICVGVFFFELNLAHFSKLNETITNSWSHTVLSVQNAESVEEANATLKVNEKAVEPQFYLGKVIVVDGQYTAYKDTVNADNLIIYGDPRTDEEKESSKGENGRVKEISTGSKFTVYYKPDDPHKVVAKTPTTLFIVMLGVFGALLIAIIVVSRILYVKLRDDTFNDSPVNIMDIPILVVVLGFMFTFFSGMVIGEKYTVGSDYTMIDGSIVAGYYDGTRSVS